MSEVRSKALAKFKSHALESILIGLFTGLIMAAVLLLSLVSPILLFVVIPFLFLPIFFSGYFSHISLNFEDKISFANTFKYFGLYFKHPFRNSFRAIPSIAKSVLMGVITFMTVSTITSVICSYVHPEFISLMEEFYKIIESSEVVDYAVVEELLNSHGGLLDQIILWCFVPSFGLGFIVFLYFITYSSLTIYFKVNIQTTNANLYPYLLKQANSLSNKKILKEFWALNWPMLLLAIVGYVIGAIIAYSTNYFDYVGVALCGVVGGMAIASLFLPIFFNNMEAIYETNAPLIKQASDELNKNMLTELQNSLKISKEQQEEIQRALDELNKHTNLNQEENGENGSQNDE